MDAFGRCKCSHALKNHAFTYDFNDGACSIPTCGCLAYSDLAWPRTKYFSSPRADSYAGNAPYYEDPSVLELRKEADRAAAQMAEETARVNAELIGRRQMEDRMNEIAVKKIRDSNNNSFEEMLKNATSISGQKSLVRIDGQFTAIGQTVTLN